MFIGSGGQWFAAILSYLAFRREIPNWNSRLALATLESQLLDNPDPSAGGVRTSSRKASKLNKIFVN